MFENTLNNLSKKIEDTRNKVLTEEATKLSYVNPFLRLLGYDVADPNQVVPEYVADIGKKKGEKVDYAIFKDKELFMLIEVKNHTENLDKHGIQLERYFNATNSKFAILTNGIEYRFYADFDNSNRMDNIPFSKINISNLRDRDLKFLSQLKLNELDIENLLNIANKQKYHIAIKDLFYKNIKTPSNDFVKFFAYNLIDKKITSKILEEMRDVIKASFEEIMKDMAYDKLNILKEKLSSKEEESEDNDDGIMTTDEELEGFFIVKSILSEKISISRIAGRDTKSYFGMLDNKNTKWICRLGFNSTNNKKLLIRTNQKETSGRVIEKTFSIDKVVDIYKYKKDIMDALNMLLE